MTLAWGDMLCGVEVTPESWVGGVVDLGDGTWHIATGVKTTYAGITLSNPGILTADAVVSYASRPIFPPSGFGGKSDAELFRAVFGQDTTCMTADPDDRAYDIWTLEIDYRGQMALSAGIPDADGACVPTYDLDNPAALQQAIGNALVLHARLAVQHG